MTEIKLYNSPWRAIKLLLVCSIFIFGGIGILTLTDFPKLVGWFSIGLFGLGYPIAIFNFFDNRPQLIINQEGIWEKRTKQNLINWKYITNAYPIGWHQNWVCLQLDKKLTSIGAQKVYLNLGQIKKVDTNRFIELIMAMSELDSAERKKKLKYVAQHGI